ncbi:MAG: AraC family transcriptional regulator [Bacteroidota bacterium]
MYKTAIIIILFSLCMGLVLKVAEAANEVPDSARYYNDCADRFKNSNSDSTIYYAENAIRVASHTGNDIELSRAYILRGVMFAMQGDHNQGLAYLKRGLILAKQTSNSDGILQAYSALGVVYSFQANYTLSVDYLLQALKIAEELHDTNQIGKIMNNMASIHMYQENYDKALELLQGVVILGDAIDSNLVEIAFINIGAIYSTRKQYYEAIRHYFKAISNAKKVNNLRILEVAYINLGHLYTYTKNLDSAQVYYNLALEVQQKLNFVQGICGTYRGLGELNIRKKDFETAEMYLIEAMDIAKNNNYFENLKEVYRTFADLYSARNDYKSSQIYLEKYYALKDSLTGLKISELESRFKIEQKDNEIILLEKEKELKDIKIGAQQKWMIGMGAALLLITVSLFLLFFQKKRKDLAYKILVEKNLELVESEKRQNLQPVSGSGIKTEVYLTEDGETQRKYEKSTLSDEQKEKLINDIRYLMEEEKVFLQPDLTIDDVAGSLEAYKKYVSQVINEKYGKNFNTFINEYRIREARRMLIDNEFQHLSIEGIAKTVGFNSKSSFNTFFKKVTGITPSYFRDKALEKT